MTEFVLEMAEIVLQLDELMFKVTIVKVNFKFVRALSDCFSGQSY